ncbi:hypothetical protein AAG570_004716 [Ranatra chinensis]|uniref:Large proline-rich protein BAG6 domain-containing protein n=1 Tax=Ranatra chinensis TaxID=642074 RepID=A0ABD0Y328_9HEMI
MASKRRNMFYRNKKREMTEIGGGSSAEQPLSHEEVVHTTTEAASAEAPQPTSAQQDNPPQYVPHYVCGDILFCLQDIQSQKDGELHVFPFSPASCSRRTTTEIERALVRIKDNVADDFSCRLDASWVFVPNSDTDFVELGTLFSGGSDGVVVSICNYHVEGPGFDSLRGQSWSGRNGNNGSSGGGRYPTTEALAELVSQMRDVNRRLQPFMDVYYELMRDDPQLENPLGAKTRMVVVIVPDDHAIGPEFDSLRGQSWLKARLPSRPVSQAEAQRLFSRVSEMMHLMAHAYHALSDVMCNLSQPPPRFLRCRPVLIQHSAVLQTGIPIQAPSDYYLFTNGGLDSVVVSMSDYHARVRFPETSVLIPNVWLKPISINLHQNEGLTPERCTSDEEVKQAVKEAVAGFYEEGILRLISRHVAGDYERQVTARSIVREQEWTLVAQINLSASSSMSSSNQSAASNGGTESGEASVGGGGSSGSEERPSGEGAESGEGGAAGGATPSSEDSSASAQAQPSVQTSGPGNFEFYMDMSPGSVTFGSVQSSAASSRSEPTGDSLGGEGGPLKTSLAGRQSALSSWSEGMSFTAHPSLRRMSRNTMESPLEQSYAIEKLNTRVYLTWPVVSPLSSLILTVLGPVFIFNGTGEDGAAAIAGPFPWGTAPPPEFIQTIMQALAGQMLGGTLGASGGISMATGDGGARGGAAADNGGGARSGGGAGADNGSGARSGGATDNGGGASGGGTASSTTNSQARGNTATHPTTSTQTRSTSRPHVHFTPGIQGSLFVAPYLTVEGCADYLVQARLPFQRPGNLARVSCMGGQTFFDPFLPCNSHHICGSTAGRRRANLGTAAATPASSGGASAQETPPPQQEAAPPPPPPPPPPPAQSTSSSSDSFPAATNNSTGEPVRDISQLFNRIVGAIETQVGGDGRQSSGSAGGSGGSVGGSGASPTFTFQLRGVRPFLPTGQTFSSRRPPSPVTAFVRAPGGRSLFTDVFETIERELVDKGQMEAVQDGLRRLVMPLIRTRMNNEIDMANTMKSINAQMRLLFESFVDVPMREDVDVVASLSQLNRISLPSLVMVILSCHNSFGRGITTKDDNQAKEVQTNGLRARYSSLHGAVGVKQDGCDTSYDPNRAPPKTAITRNRFRARDDGPRRHAFVQLAIYARSVVAILRHCCLNGASGCDAIFATLTRHLMAEVPQTMQEWVEREVVGRLRRMMDSTVDDMPISQHIVYRMAPPATNQQQPASPPPQPMETEERPPAVVVADQQDESPLPDVIIGAEPWHNTLPPDWVPIITRDRERQRRGAVQGPLSEAYLTGMPTKRRKLVAAAKPHGTLATVISESMASAIGAAGITGGEGIAEAAGCDPGLRAAYRQEVRSSVETTLRSHPDYAPDKYPNAAKYFQSK